MPWAAIIPAATAAVGAIGGAVKAHQANEYADKQNKARLQELRYKPFGGSSVRESTPGSSMFGEILGGASSGAALGMSGYNAYASAKEALAKAKLAEKAAKTLGSGPAKVAEIPVQVPEQKAQSYYNPAPLTYNANQYSAAMIPTNGPSTDQGFNAFLAGQSPLETKAAQITTPQTSNVMNQSVQGTDAPYGLEPSMPAPSTNMYSMISPAVIEAMGAINKERNTTPTYKTPYLALTDAEKMRLYGTTNPVEINRYMLARNMSNWKSGV